MEKITFLQPGYAHYRDQLFDILSNKNNIHYIYENSINIYPGSKKPNININYNFLNKKWFIKWIDLVRYLINDNPDIVITSVANDFRTLLAYIYTRVFRKKLILWLEQWREPNYPKLSIKGFLGRIRNNISKYIILNSDALVVVGTASKKYALSLGKKESKIFFSLQCSNDIRTNCNKINENIGNKKYKFLFLSRIIPLKGLDVLIKAFSTLERERDDVELIIGGEGSYKESCEKLANILNIKKITFLGAIDPDKIGEVFSNSNVFVLPSYNIKNSGEGWGLVINEAMSMGLPIITTDAVGASYDMVDSGKNGFVVDNGSQIELYTAMKKILDCDIYQMGCFSRKIFEEKNNYSRMAQGFTDSIAYVSSLD